MEFSIFLIIVLVFSAILHEYAHGMTAYLLGDPTAKNAGRLTLNPVPHIDPFFTILLPFLMIISGIGFVIGGAKPVPVNPFNLKGKYAELKVALSGPMSNIFLAFLFGLIIRFFPYIRESETLFFAFGAVVFINLLLAVFNLLPIPPLDGSHILFAIFPNMGGFVRNLVSQYGFFILFLILILFFPFIIHLLMFFIGLFFYPLTGVPLASFWSLL